MLSKSITKLIGIATVFKETIRNTFRDYSAVREGFSIFHPCHHIEINKDVMDIAIQTPFSYYDVLTLYKLNDKDKGKTLRNVAICSNFNIPISVAIKDHTPLYLRSK